ncbi:MAG: ABC transporter permease [Thermoanaerobaculia bacterium]
MWKDARLGIRRWLKRPLSTLVALGMLALGIGISASVLSLVRAVLLRPLPFKDPSHLVQVASLNQGEKNHAWPVSYPDFLDWRARSRTLSDLAAVTEELLLKVAGPEGPELISGEMVSASYFPLLGVKPVLGRTFLANEDATPGGNNVAVLGYELWRQRFHGDPAVLGKSFELNETSYAVVGVLPAGFHGMSDRAQVWLPISMATTLQSRALDSRKYRWLSVVGRLRTGLSLQSARQEMAGLAAQLAREYPDTNGEIEAMVEPLASAWFGAVRPLLLLLLGGSVLVLLIVYGNLSTLWVAEGIARKPELSLRSALGAGPRRLVGQTLMETLLMTLTGTALGLLASTVGTPALVRTTGIAFRSFVHVGIDAFVAAAILALALGLGIAFGSIPALAGLRAGLGSVSRGAGQTATVGRGSHWLQSLLIVYEVALATILLLAAGTIAADFRQRSRIDLGFRTDHLLTLRTSLQGQAYARDERVHAMVLHAMDRLRSVPGVSDVTFAGPAIPTDPWHAFHITLENRPELEAVGGGPLILRHHVSPGYFHTLGAPVLKGREFSLDDHAGSIPVVLISQAMNERYWLRENPVGKRLKLGAADSKFPWLTVVGVVGDVKHEGRGGGARPGPDLYLPILQSVARTPPVLNLVLRCSVPPESLAPAVLRELRRAAPGLPAYDVKTMDERLAAQLSETRILSGLMIGSALVALLLSMIGVYGVISYVVGQRTREIGIRMAFGATGKELTYLLVGQGLRLALIGAGTGVLAALALNRLAKGFLHDVAPLAPAIVIAMPLLMICLAGLTCYLPVHRALREKSLAALARGIWMQAQ